MRKNITFAMILLAFNSPSIAQENTEPRQVVEMPTEMKQMFLKNMRGHMEALDQIIAALAENNLSKAADIAESSMGVGHGTKRQCDDDNKGKHSHEFKQNHSSHKEKKFGQFMPIEMKMMGMQLHQSANKFATIARGGNINEAYKALGQISSSCVMCHQSFQVK